MKNLIVVLAFMGIAVVSYSQTFMHGAGIAGFGILIDNKETGNIDNGVYTTLCYSPRFSFLEGENTSVSVGIPLRVGFGGEFSYTSSSYYGEEETNTLIYMVNVPVMIDFNFGAGAHKETEKRFGMFIGAGLGLFHGTVVSDDWYYGYLEKHTITTTCPTGNIGFRIAVGRHQKNIEGKITYMRGLTDRKPHVFGFGVGFNF